MLVSENISLRVISVPLMHPFPADAVRTLLCGGPVVTVTEAYPDNPLESGTMRLLLREGRPLLFHSINIAQEFPKIVGSHDTLRAKGGVSTEAIMEAVRRLIGSVSALT